ncbi:MAG: type 4a pilus biogenesis protein PilO [Candidatus Omnitrophica bacterium]|nr:type 4a pilus biogenesis protein PilO [Candidatus Omnitrophota bacterium]
MIKIQSMYKFIFGLSKREKLVLYLGVFFVMLTILDRTVIGPIYSKMSSLDKEIKEKEFQLNKDLRILSQKDKILSESARYATFLAKAKSEEEEVTDFLKEIESIATKSEIYLVDLKPGSVKIEGSSKRYTVSLNCEGEMTTIFDFMYNIESAKKLLVIEKYQISPKTSGSSTAKCSMTISKVVLQ